MQGQVQRVNNFITLRGGFGIGELRPIVSALHHAIEIKGYQDLVLDFSRTRGALQGPMLMLCAHVAALRTKGIGISVRAPDTRKVASLFHSTNWLHLLDPIKPRGNSEKHLPARMFRDDAEERKAVTEMMNRILVSQPELTRGDLAAMDWVIGEVTGNVLTHAESPVGGFVQLTKYADRFELAVADPGLSIPTTLRNSHPHLRSDESALEAAVKEGVTRDRRIGQGNGLFGTFGLATATDQGYLNISSGHAHLGARKGGVKLDTTSVPIPGTLIVVAMGTTDADALRSALRFGGKIHEVVVDYIERTYEDPTDDVLRIIVPKEAGSMFSRGSAAVLRKKVLTLAAAAPAHRIVLDFDSTPIFSSSFADEFVAKLADELGRPGSGRLTVVGLNETTEEILIRSIAQRFGS